MSKPAVIVVAQPVQSEAIVYGPLAAKSSNADPNGQLAVVFNLANQELAKVTLVKVVTSFPGSQDQPAVTTSLGKVVEIEPGTIVQWSFLKTEMIYLAEPAPPSVRFELFFDGFSDPVSAEMPLAPYHGAVYPFPAKTTDLKQNEYWYANSGFHLTGGGGQQMFAHDLSVIGYDAASGTWERKLSATADATQNESYRAWGKPIHAMAAGTVTEFNDGMPASTPPNKPVPTPKPAFGNYFKIQHGSDLAVYGHFQAGTMNAALLQVGAQVAEGDFLGLCGSSGNSSEPHLHVHIIQPAEPFSGGRPLMFTGMHALEMTQVDPEVWPPDSNAPWSVVDGRALPNVWSAVWPGPLKRRLDKQKWGFVLAWAWTIVIGGLMITPGGIDCFKCGPLWESILAIVSIGVGVAGIARELFRKAAPRTANVAPRVILNNDFDGDV